MKRGWIALLGGMAMGLALCLGAQEEIHKNSYRIDLSTKGRAKAGEMVSILSCDAKHTFVVPYEDKDLTIPMANPLVIPANGQLGFFLPVGQEVQGELRGKAKVPLFRCVHGAHVPEVIISGSVQAKMQGNGDVIIEASPQPPVLTCGPYQHVYHWSGTCGPSPTVCSDNAIGCYALSICAPIPPDKCVDDMHEVTEREWQALLERLKVLESNNR